MPEKPFDLDFQAERQPFNTIMVLDLGILSKIVGLIQDEVLLGLVDTPDEDHIVLHMNLDQGKFLLLQQTLSDTEEPATKLP
jgi:hypothetical protein